VLRGRPISWHDRRPRGRRCSRGGRDGGRRRSDGRGPEALEGVVFVAVVVPILVVGAGEAYAEVHLFARLPLDGGHVDREGKLVGKAVARAAHVGARGVRGRRPVVQCVASEDGLVEVEVHHSHDALDGAQVGHVGAFEADLLVAEAVEEVGAPARLVEQRRKRRNFRGLRGRGVSGSRRAHGRQNGKSSL